MARIAAGSHLALQCGTAEPWTIPLTVETVDAAWRIGWYLVEHALAAHDLIGADEHLDGARSVLKWIIANKKPTFTKREAFNALRAQFRTVTALEPALALLVSHGYVRELPARAPKRAGRPPTQAYEVNPHACAQNPHNTQNSSGVSARSADGLADAKAEYAAGHADGAGDPGDDVGDPTHLIRSSTEAHQHGTADIHGDAGDADAACPAGAEGPASGSPPQRRKARIIETHASGAALLYLPMLASEVWLVRNRTTVRKINTRGYPVFLVSEVADWKGKTDEELRAIVAARRTSGASQAEK